MSEPNDLDNALAKAAQRQYHERIVREGFQIAELEANPTDLCQYATNRKVKGRYTTEPCGKPATIVILFLSPTHPDHIETPFCKECLGNFIKSLIGNLQY